MQPALALSTALLLLSPTALASDIVTGPVDKATFQALINGSAPGDRILCLAGEYDFRAPGAVLITHGLEILAADPNHPPLFVGDTTDGLPDGPLVAGTDALAGNTCFVLPAGAVVHGLYLEDLQFAGFERAFLSHVGYDPANCVPTPLGSATDVVLVRNYIRNCWRGIQLIGSVDRFMIAENYVDLGGVVTASGHATPLNIAGDGIGCSNGGVAALLPVSNGVVRRNILIAGADHGAAAAVVFGAPNTIIEQNAMIGGTADPDAAGLVVGERSAFFGPILNPIDLGVIRDNFITGNPNAPTLILVGPSPMVCRVEHNTIGGGLFHVLMVQEANGFQLRRNSLLGTFGLASIVLDTSSHDNFVEVLNGTVVRNFGLNNTVIHL